MVRFKVALILYLPFLDSTVSIPKWYDLKIYRIHRVTGTLFCFNSKMVRFKVFFFSMLHLLLASFNSKMVRFKAPNGGFLLKFLLVSIPKWYDLKKD